MSHAEIDAFAQQFIDAILAGDVDAVISIYADGATIWHNFDNIDQTPVQNGKTLAAMHRLLPGFRYDEIRRTILDDGFWQQHVLRGTGAGGDLSMPAALRVYVSDGKVTRLEEYLDPAPFTVAIGR